MPLYFLLGTMTPEGNRGLHQNQSWVVEAADDLNVEGAKILGQYGVLGRYDFVTLVEADDNNAVAPAVVGVRHPCRVALRDAERHHRQHSGRRDAAGHGRGYDGGHRVERRGDGLTVPHRRAIRVSPRQSASGGRIDCRHT